MSYGQPSHFIREYRRMFGVPPSPDGPALHVATVQSIAAPAGPQGGVADRRRPPG